MKANRHEGLWRVVSRGVAAQNIDIDDVWLEVFCPEFTGFADGEITSNSVDLTTQGVDDRGHHYTAKITTAVTVRCKWKPQGTNRVTAPNIRRGERVEVWQYADADTYYWSVTGEDDDLRKLETVTHAFSNTKDESQKELSKENTYSYTVSTHQKKVELHTSKSDGEPFTHTLQLDTKNGLFTYKDDVGNVIQVNSKNNQIYIENASGSTYVMDGGNIQVTAPSSMTFNSPDVTVNADNFTVNGASTLNGKTNMTSGASVSGSLQNNGVNVGSTHTHGNVEPGRGNTGTPK